LQLIDYIRSSIEILTNIKREEFEYKEKDHLSLVSTSKDEPPSDYEDSLQKLEAEVRNHIRVLT